MWAMIAPFSELWDRSQGSSARSSTPSTASDLQPCRDAQGSMVRGYRWPAARLRFDTHVMARFLTRNSAGSTVDSFRALKIATWRPHVRSESYPQDRPHEGIAILQSSQDPISYSACTWLQC